MFQLSDRQLPGRLHSLTERRAEPSLRLPSGTELIRANPETVAIRLQLSEAAWNVLADRLTADSQKNNSAHALRILRTVMPSLCPAEADLKVDVKVLQNHYRSELAQLSVEPLPLANALHRLWQESVGKDTGVGSHIGLILDHEDAPAIRRTLAGPPASQLLRADRWYKQSCDRMAEVAVGGSDGAALEKWLEEAGRRYTLFTAAFEAMRHGDSMGEAAKALKIGRPTVGRWLRLTAGDRMPWEQSNGLHVRDKKIAERFLELSESAKGYLLGLYLMRPKSAGVHSSSLRLVSTTPSEEKLVGEIVATLQLNNCRVAKRDARPDEQNYFVRSEALLNFLNRETLRKTAVPHHLLLTPEASHSFMRAVLTIRGAHCSRAIIVPMCRSYRLALDIAQVFASADIVPSVLQKKARLVFNPTLARELVKRDLVTLEGKKPTKVATRPSESTQSLIQRYESVCRHAREFPNTSLKALAEAGASTVDEVRSWTRRNGVPKAILAIQKLRGQLVSTCLPEPLAFQYLVKEHGFRPRAAAYFAAHRSFAQLQSSAALCTRLGVDVRKDPRQLLVSETELQGLLAVTRADRAAPSVGDLRTFSPDLKRWATEAGWMENREELTDFVFRTIRPMVESVTHNLIGRSHRFSEKDDLVAVAMVKCMKALEHYQSDYGSLISFIAQCAKWRVLDEVRKRRYATDNIDEHDIARADYRVENKELLEFLLSRLPTAFHKIFLLRVEHGMLIPEIAAHCSLCRGHTARVFARAQKIAGNALARHLELSTA